MGKKNSPFPSPSMVFIHGDHGELVTFSPIQGRDVTKKVLREFRDKDSIEFQLGCDSWLIVLIKDKEQFQYSLWNPVSMENLIKFPKLELKPGQEINNRILTTPPGNPDCMLVLFVKTEERVHSLFYCRVGGEDWTKQSINNDGVCLEDPVMCNGKIYCTCFRSGEKNRLAVIDIKPDSLGFSLSCTLKHPRLNSFFKTKSYMVESCGQLFIIYVQYNKRIGKPELEACDVHLFSLDWLGTCRRVESFEDRAFFVGDSSQFSCLAIDSIKENHIYFILPDDLSMYAFNMEAQTIAFSMPGLNSIFGKWITNFWLMPDLRYCRPNNAIKERVFLGKKNLVKRVTHRNIKLLKNVPLKLKGFHEKLRSHGSSNLTLPSSHDYSNLPSDILVKVGRRLQLQDYLSFRSVNTVFRSAALLNSRTKLALLTQPGDIFSPPMLISRPMNNKVWNLIDPKHKERYFITPPNEFEDATMCFSKEGWCVVKHKKVIFLWNPIAKKTIKLPNIPDPWNFTGCSFSSSPHSPESDCTVVLAYAFAFDYWIFSIKLGRKKWECHFFISDYFFNKVGTDNCLMLYKGVLYFLDEKGNLGVFKKEEEEEEEVEIVGGGNEDEDEDEDEHVGPADHGEINVDVNGLEHEEIDYKVLNHKIERPCKSFHQKFLLECDSNLLSIFVGFPGSKVKVFKLDESKMAWSRLKDIGNNTIYLSRFSSFSLTASPGMQNRIYFSRYYDKGLVYYSLESEALGVDGTEDVLESFDLTEEQTMCGWITPTF